MKNKTVRSTLIGFVFILPFFILYSLFVIWPVIQGFYVSLHKWTLMGKQKFIGFENYIDFMGDKNFWEALQNTCIFVIIVAPSMVIVALLLALLANRSTRFKKFFRIAFYMPSILSVAVASFIVLYMFSSHTGLINGVLVSLGIISSGNDLLWLQETSLAWVVVSSTTVWWTIGFSMMIYISSLQEISPAVIEAASIDGASKWQQLCHITLPLLKPTTFMIILLQTIACFKVFGQIYLVTGGGPAGSTRPLIQYIYEAGFVKNKLGYAASMSYVLFLILVVLALVQLYIQKRSDN